VEKKDVIHIKDECKSDPYPSTERISNKQYWIGWLPKKKKKKKKKKKRPKELIG
jgi:hypothetical protein